MTQIIINHNQICFQCQPEESWPKYVAETLLLEDYGIFDIWGTRFVRFYSEMRDFIQNMRFYSWNTIFWLQWSSTYNQIWFHCQPGGTQAKKIAETLLFGWVVGFLVSGDVRFYSWCEILFRNAGFYSWKPSISTQIIIKHNEKCTVRHCTTATATIKFVSRGILT